MSGEGLKLAGDDGGGRDTDWQSWSAETDGMGESFGYRRLFVTRPVGRAGVFAVSPGMSRNVYTGPIMPRLPFAPVDIGRLATHEASPN
jgi:hypothetical protein